MSNVPQLRFREFSGEWEEKKLKNITSKIGSGSTPRGGNKVYQNHGIPFIRSQNVNNDKLTLDNTAYISEKINTEMKNSIVQGLDILLNITGASIGRSCVVPDNFLVGNVNQHVCIVRLNDENSPYFLQPLLASHAGQKLIYQGQTGSGREGLNFQSIASFKFILPSKQEQEKIASFLSSVDTKIEQLTSKVKLLQEYKKGVMQKIFSQEIRFQDDDGSEYPEWVENKLGSYGKLINGLTYSPDNIADKGLLVLRSSNIQKNKITLEDNVYVNIDVSDESLTKENDILICVRNGSKRLIGKSTIIPKNLIKSTHGAFMTVFRGESNDFISHWFQTPIFYKEVHKNLGATINSINGGNLKKFKTIFPSRPEQIKIANFLSSIDSKIEQTQKQLDSTKEFKKALLQQMFV